MRSSKDFLQTLHTLHHSLPSLSDARPEPFQLSDAPIHRIQTLVISLQEALKSFEPFKSVQAAFFVRRDFDTCVKHGGCPVFNATFYAQGIHDHYLSLNPSQPTEQQLEALHKKALNSAGTPRAALERAVRRLKEMAKNASNATEAEKIESAHHWLELYSRVTYRGGVPGFLVGKYKAQHRIPPLNLIAVRSRPNAADKWDDAVLQLEKGKIVLPDECSWEEQPDLTCKDAGTESAEDIADPLYRTLQRWLENGIDPNSKASGNSNTPTTSRLLLFALPIYEDLTFGADAKVSQHGAFLGFLFLLLPSPSEWSDSDAVITGAGNAFANAEKMLLQIAPLLNHFAASLLESEFEEILREDYTGGDPFKFVAETIPRINGWNLQKASSAKNTLEINLAQNLFSKATEAETAVASPTDDWTLAQTSCPEYRSEINRRFRHYLKVTNIHRHERLNAQQSGFLESAHDYSKDLNAIDSTFGRLNESIEETANSIRESMAARPELTEFTEKVAADLVKLAKIRDYSLLRPRFMMAHARTQTEGYYYEQPDWLVQRLVNGTRGDIDFIIRLLVWEPIGSRRYLELVEMAPQNTEVSDWSRLFAYDEFGRHPEIDILLAGYLKRCFLRPPENGGPMSPGEFGRLHPPPALNSDRHKADVLLPGLRERTIGVRGLLPLLVFSLRAAFQHAWLTSFVKAALRSSYSASFCPVSEVVTLSEDVTNSSYSLRIEFPNPLSASIRERIVDTDLFVPLSMPDRLPWGNWEREINFYRGLGLPWNAQMVHTEDGNTLRLEIIASR
jgi:hypothetical protein